MGLFIHFYIIFGTNLLTQGPVQIAVFFAYFSISQKRNIKRSPNGMKPLGELFLEQTWSRGLGVDVKKSPRRPRGRGRAYPPPPPGRALHPCGPLVTCSDPTSDYQASVYLCHPWIGMLAHTVHQCIYQSAITCINNVKWYIPHNTQRKQSNGCGVPSTPSAGWV